MRKKLKRLAIFFTSLVFSCDPLASDSIVELETLTQSKVKYLKGESEYFSEIWKTKVISNVSKPKLETFKPTIKSTDTAIIIAPGGGLYAQSIESEGREVARWLNSKGITAFVLRYRLVPTEKEAVEKLGEDWQADYNNLLTKVGNTLPYSIEDGLSAIAYVRKNADLYQINKNKIGFMGFSAGGAIALGASYQYTNISKPNFIIPVYPWTDSIAIEQPKSDAPPMIIICATDDAIGLAQGAIELYSSYFKSGKNVALHMYSKGNHGFGMRKQDLPSDMWIDRVYDWLIAEKWVSNSS